MMPVSEEVTSPARRQRRRLRPQRRRPLLVQLILPCVAVLLGLDCSSLLLMLPKKQFAAEAAQTTTASASSTTARQAAFASNSNSARPNFLVIVCDQLRYDVLGYVQARMSNYDGKVHVKTPNLDRLAALGITFEVAYTTSPSCGPARASLKTGCTLARTGLVSNKMAKDSNLTRSVPIFRQRLDRLVSYEQVMTQYLNYSVESYGKWHTDPSLYYTKTLPIRRAVQYTSYDFNTNVPLFDPVQTIKPVYQVSLAYLLERDQVNATPGPGQLLNKMSQQGYDPLPIDTSYDVAGEGAVSASTSSSPTNGRGSSVRRFPDTDRVSVTRYARERPRHRKPVDGVGSGSSSPTSGAGDINAGESDAGDDDDDVDDEGDEGDGGDSTTAGRDALGPTYTTTAILGQMSLKALERNARAYQLSKQPFLLSVHFNAPHPPVIGTGVYFDYYYANRNNLAIPASLLDPMADSAYKYSNQRKFLRTVSPPSSVLDASYIANTSNSDEYYPFMDKNRIAELTAAYYSTVEEVDAWIGRLVTRLEQLNVMSSTRIVFTSDHGDLLGAHGMVGKSVLLEEATRVPLILYAPGTTDTNGWEGGRVLKRPVSHLSLFATLLDYAGGGAAAAMYDDSDGTSLRSYVERRSYNANHDDDVVVVESNGRRPLNATRLSGMLGGSPSFMVRKGNFKLLVPRTSSSRVLDMMYNLTEDPWEMTNLLGSSGVSASDDVIGKAEHLKALLVEWMQRNDGPHKYYSDPVYNMNEGLGDLQEVRNRQTWRRVPLWISDPALKFGLPVRVVTSTTPPSASSPNLFVTSPSSSSSSSWDAVKFVRNEYLYVGRTIEGEALLRVDVQGPDAFRFTVLPNQARLAPNEPVKIKVSYLSGSNFGTNASDLIASVRLRVTMDGSSAPTTYRTVPLVCVLDGLEEETLAVRPTLRSNRIVEPMTDQKTKNSKSSDGGRSKRRSSAAASWAAACLTVAAVVGAVATASVIRRRRSRGGDSAVPWLNSLSDGSTSDDGDGGGGGDDEDVDDDDDDDVRGVD